MTLEELLNKLIQMGWKPRGEEERVIRLNKMGTGYDRERAGWYLKGYDKISLRDLVSIESGFRQFVLDNQLTNLGNDNWFVIDEVETDSETVNYWLAKSSIQTDLEKFILDNVLIPNE